MFYFFIFLIGFITALGVLVIFKRKKDKRGIVATRSKEKIRNINKLIEFINKKEKVTNNDIEQELKVSNATATRYLDELEKMGKIKQVGRTGKSVYYIKTK